MSVPPFAPPWSRRGSGPATPRPGGPTPIKVNSAHPGWVRTDMGGPSAPMEVSEGGKTSMQLATLPDDGPSGGYFHPGEPLPW
jgi:NAD(P)-dependent dehydrogenase (short-subunit alcohol dehydrogenase family)